MVQIRLELFFSFQEKKYFLRYFYIGIVEVAVFESKMHGSNPVRAIFSKKIYFLRDFLYKNRLGRCI
jgi:hypothetical protein